MKSYEALIRPHMAKLYRLAYGFTGSREDAEDLVQDLVLKVHPRHGELARLDNPGTWLAKVLYRMCVDHKRRVERAKVRLAGDLNQASGHGAGLGDLEELECPQAGPLAQLENERFIRRLHQVLLQLSPEHRELLVMHDIEGFSAEEIQEILGLPQGTIKSRLHRGRARLRGLLEQGTDWAVKACKEV